MFASTLREEGQLPVKVFVYQLIIRHSIYSFVLVLTFIWRASKVESKRDQIEGFFLLASILSPIKQKLVGSRGIEAANAGVGYRSRSEEASKF